MSDFSTDSGWDVDPDSSPNGGSMGSLALIPAHNEAATIAAAVRAVRDQVDRVVVVDDRSSDGTDRIARRAGAEVFATRDNSDRKAGALNLALARYRADVVLITDADSQVAPTFMTVALEVMRDKGVGAVGGLFHGECGAGLLGAFQRNEYERYTREIGRRRDEARVLTGTGTVFRGAALDELHRRKGRWYDPDALTEDFAITLDLMDLGWRCVSPQGCEVITEVMPTWRELWVQRLRWQRGALEAIHSRGLTPVTWPYFRQQLAMFVGVFATASFLTLLALTVAFGPLGLTPWTALTGLFAIERCVTVRRRGWRATLLAALLIPEMVYDIFLQAVLIRSALTTTTKWS
jgi:cellulose synthase/poly-beta-1,6-N-acetylglucosamine synthase-like glycosyltransferase